MIMHYYFHLSSFHFFKFFLLHPYGVLKSQSDALKIKKEKFQIYFYRLNLTKKNTNIILVRKVKKCIVNIKKKSINFKNKLECEYFLI